MKSVSDEVIPLMQEENALVTEYEKLLAGAKIDWEGETLNLSLLTPYLKSKDPKVRRKACEKQNEFFLSIEDKLDDLYDRLVKNGRFRQINWDLRLIPRWDICGCRETATEERKWKISAVR